MAKVVKQNQRVDSLIMNRKGHGRILRGLLWDLFYLVSGVAVGNHEYHESVQLVSD